MLDHNIRNRADRVARERGYRRTYLREAEVAVIDMAAKTMRKLALDVTTVQGEAYCSGVAIVLGEIVERALRDRR